MLLETPAIYSLCIFGVWVCFMMLGVVVMEIGPSGQKIMPANAVTKPADSADKSSNQTPGVDNTKQTLEALRVAYQKWRLQQNTTEQIRIVLAESEKDLGMAALAKVKAREAHLEAVNVSFS